MHHCLSLCNKATTGCLCPTCARRGPNPLAALQLAGPTGGGVRCTLKKVNTGLLSGMAYQLYLQVGGEARARTLVTMRKLHSMVQCGVCFNVQFGPMCIVPRYVQLCDLRL